MRCLKCFGEIRPGKTHECREWKVECEDARASVWMEVYPGYEMLQASRAATRGLRCFATAGRQLPDTVKVWPVGGLRAYRVKMDGFETVSTEVENV